jgi:uncharacterized protein GlcG (DUF336 family)
MALEPTSRSIGLVLTEDEIVDRPSRSGQGGPSRSTRPPEGTDVPLTTDETTRVVTAAQKHAADNGWRITVAIVDEGGLLQALSRMDGAPPLSAQIAEAKACGAALWHREGDGLVEVAKTRPAFFEGVDRLARLPILPALGSVLVRRDGVVLGAVGCSGATAEQDKECGQAGLAAIGL